VAGDGVVGTERHGADRYPGSSLIRSSFIVRRSSFEDRSLTVAARLSGDLFSTTNDERRTTNDEEAPMPFDLDSLLPELLLAAPSSCSCWRAGFPA